MPFQRIGSYLGGGAKSSRTIGKPGPSRVRTESVVGSSSAPKVPEAPPAPIVPSVNDFSQEGLNKSQIKRTMDVTAPRKQLNQSNMPKKRI